MKFLAAPIIIFLGIWLAIEYWIVIGEENSKPHAKYQQLRFLLWGFFVVIVSFMIEWIGVKTGLIYGDYSYGNTLFPFIDQVPIAIGFAWLVMLLSSSGVAQRMFPINYFKNPYRAAFFTALLMTIFDFFMEPVAMELNYWNWSDNIVPLHNYVAWFVISYSLALLAFKNRLFLGRMPKVFYHTYFAQLIYFLMIFFA